MDVPFHAVGRGGVARAPMRVQADGRVGVDDGGDRLVERLLAHVALVDEGDVPAVQTLERARRLGRAQAAAVAERGRQVALAGAVELGLEPRDRSERARPAQPMLGLGERVQDADRREPLLHEPLETLRAMGHALGAQAADHRPVGDDLDVLVVGERTVDLARHRGEAVLQLGDERRRVGRNAGLRGVGADVAMVVLPRNELIAVVAVVVRARQAQVTRLQFVDRLGEHAQLEGAPVDLTGCGITARRAGDERPPPVRHEGQVDEGHGGATTATSFLAHDDELGVPMAAAIEQEDNGLLERAVLRGRQRPCVIEEADEGGTLPLVRAGRAAAGDCRRRAQHAPRTAR